VKRLVRTVSIMLRPWPSLLAWAGLVFVVSSIPLPQGPGVDLPIAPDKIAHGVAYAVLAGLAVRATSQLGRRRVVAVAAIGAAIVYGALLENWQRLLGGRATELGDAVANAVGAVIGGLVALYVCRPRRQHTANSMEPPDHGEAGRSQAD
jgi:VanZ family protein